MQTGLKWCGLSAPWGRLSEVGRLVVPPITGTWPTDTLVNTPVFTAKGILIISLWQIWTPPLVPDKVMQSKISGQSMWHRQLERALCWSVDPGQEYGLYLVMEGRFPSLVTSETSVLLPWVFGVSRITGRSKMSSKHSSVAVRSRTTPVMTYVGLIEHKMDLHQTTACLW